METPRWELDRTVTLRRTIRSAPGAWARAPRWPPHPPSPARWWTLSHLGVTRIDIPITHEKVWKILHEKGVAE